MTRTPRHRLLAVTTTLFLAFWVCAAWGGILGGGSASTEYVGGADADGRKLQVSVVLDRVLFPIVSAGDKYRIIRLVLRNGGKELKLSPEKDTISLTIRSDDAAPREVKGVVNMGNEDPEFWRSLTQEQRNMLAYDEKVPAAPGGDRGAPAVLALYVFFPTAQVSKLPDSLSYRIDALGEPIDVRPRPVAAR